MALVDAWGRSSRLCLSISGFMKLCMTSKIASQISSIGVLRSNSPVSRPSRMISRSRVSARAR
jgi:hypothetical protein